MRTVRVKPPELALLAGTRGMLGAGAGLLLGNKLSERNRKAVGWALFLTGVISTIPLASSIFHRNHQRS